MLSALLCLLLLVPLFDADPLTPEEITAIVNLHNNARSIVDPPAQEMKKMVWNDLLVEIANMVPQDTCMSTDGDPSYGENIAISTNSVSMESFFGKWMGEQTHYTFSNNSCATGKNCNRYKQVIWSTSMLLGCIKNYCPHYKNGHYVNYELRLLCKYEGPGNIEDVSPYIAVVATTTTMTTPTTTTTTTTMSAEDINTILDLHNQARNNVDPPALDMQEMEWDVGLAELARIVLLEACLGGVDTSNYGENIAILSGAWSTDSIESLFADWMGEQSHYTFWGNSCASGKNCNRYKQVIWSTSNKIGCFKHACDTADLRLLCKYDGPSISGGLSPYQAECVKKPQPTP